MMFHCSSKEIDADCMNKRDMTDKNIFKQSYRSAVIKGTQILKLAQINNPDYDALELLLHITGMDKTKYLIKSMEDMPQNEYEQYISLIEKRQKHIPLQHLIGFTNFYGRNYKVNENVLIPRYDTEVLVEEVMKLTDSNSRVLDMCTGSGCIIISLAAYGHTAKCKYGAVGVDISQKALEVAEYNKLYNEVSYVEFIQSDMFEAFADKNENLKFDVIVSNPPYIPTKIIENLEDEVKLYDPMLALDGSEDGLKFYRNITDKARDYLEKGAYLCYEIGCEQAQDVSDIMLSFGYKDIKVIKDLAGLDRVVIGKWF